MAKRLRPDNRTGVWPATPTPFTEKMTVDGDSVRKMIQHHLRLGVRGLFLAGTCGEGPWMPERERRRLVEAAAKQGKGKLLLAVQVTGNSAARVLGNIKAAKDYGTDIAVIAPPLFMLNATPRTLLRLHAEAIQKSPLPVGIYDRGKHSPVFVPDSVIAKVYQEPNVVMVKDSSSDPGRRKLALAARRERPNLRLLNGDEFRCVEYLKAGYDGLPIGGGIFSGHLVSKIIGAVSSKDLRTAEALQQRMIQMLYAVYGGKQIECWLSGLKRLLVEMGIFKTWKNYLGYPLTRACVRDIHRILESETDVLFPEVTIHGSSSLKVVL
jgi:4-hydroxy-tetrahydrodipicolinate synthase